MLAQRKSRRNSLVGVFNILPNENIVVEREDSLTGKSNNKITENTVENREYIIEELRILNCTIFHKSLLCIFSRPGRSQGLFYKHLRH